MKVLYRFFCLLLCLVTFSGCQEWRAEEAPLGSELKHSVEVIVEVKGELDQFVDPTSGSMVKERETEYLITSTDQIWFGKILGDDVPEGEFWFFKTEEEKVPDEWGFSSKVNNFYSNHTLMLLLNREQTLNRIQRLVTQLAREGVVEQLYFEIDETHGWVKLKELTLFSGKTITLGKDPSKALEDLQTLEESATNSHNH